MSPDHQAWMEPGDRFVGGQLDCWKKSVRGELLYCIYIIYIYIYIYVFHVFPLDFGRSDLALKA